MFSKKVSIGFIALLIISMSYGFLNQPSTQHTYITNAGWGANEPFVTKVIKPNTGPNKRFMVHVHQYKLLGVDRRNLLIRPQDKVEDNIPSHWVKQDKEWIQIYRVYATKQQLRQAKSIDDLIANYPKEWHKSYELTSLWIKSYQESAGKSIMSQDETLNQEQKQLLHQMNLGGHFEMVINYQQLEGPTGEQLQKRMNLEFTVVPATQANYPQGQKALISYFESNMSEDFLTAGTEFSTLVVKFTIAKNGKAKDIVITHQSNYQQIDKKMVKLTQQMSTWIPAQNEKGEKVEQTFELIYGRPGC